VNDETDEFVYPILDYTLTLGERLDRGETLSLDEEQSFLGRLLSRELRTEDSTPASDEIVTSRQIEELRYAMVCAVDEFFISSTSWKDRWNERKLESKYYATNDRAWKFWRGASQALSDGDVEMVEVYLLCVMLGFRGQMAEDRQGLQAWVGDAQRLIESRRARLWSAPPSREPRTFVPPLHGRRSFESASLRLGVLVLATVSLVVFLVVQQLASL
jgi:type VI secretion system protein ImpK